MGEHDTFGEIVELPLQGWKQDALLGGLKKLRGAEKDYNSGKAFGGIYCDDKSIKTAINAAYCDFADSNGLYPGIFPALRKFELEVVRMTRGLLHGDAKVQGVMTTGGSETILLAIKAYKERGVKLGITEPEAVIPLTAHPAFAKGCNYFGVKFVGAAIDNVTGMVDLTDVRRKINRNTIFLVGSAPQFAHGVIDPITELGALASKHKIGLHVDACLGGFLLPFVQKLGYLKGIEWDFRVSGVTTMSADVHKYGYGPKGSSVCLFRDAELRKEMFFAWTEWCGGMYCSPSMTGSRSGGIIASTWATLMLLGEDGYLKLVSQGYESFLIVRDGINKIPGFKTLGNSNAACIAFQCTDGSPNKVYQVAAAMKEHFGWSLNYLQKPVACGLQVGTRSTFDPHEWLRNLQTSLEHVQKEPERYSGGLTQIYGMAANLGDRTVVGDLLKNYLDAMYETGPASK